MPHPLPPPWNIPSHDPACTFIFLELHHVHVLIAFVENIEHDLEVPSVAVSFTEVFAAWKNIVLGISLVIRKSCLKKLMLLIH